jgi:hypothetical protein
MTFPVLVVSKKTKTKLIPWNRKIIDRSLCILSSFFQDGIFQNNFAPSPRSYYTLHILCLLSLEINREIHKPMGHKLLLLMRSFGNLEFTAQSIMTIASAHFSLVIESLKIQMRLLNQKLYFRLFIKTCLRCFQVALQKVFITLI